jgi:site-specific DNA recombinase
MRAAVYARVSTRRQDQDQTIESQLAALEAWAGRQAHDLRPEHIFTDPGHSGARLDRPGLDRLRDAAAAGEFDVIAIYSPDRLSRRYVHQALLLEEFRKAGCAVEFIQRPISDDPHDQLLLQIQGAVAEYERAVLGERFRRGKVQRAREGHWVAARAPYGYRYVPKRDGVPGHLVIDEAEAAVVQMMYRWLVDDQMSVRMIIRQLADGAWRPRSGKPVWSNTVVHRILSDPVYAGTGYSNRFYRTTSPDPRRQRRRPDDLTCRRQRPREEWIPIPVPAIVDANTHEHAIAQLSRNTDLCTRRNNRHFYLLRCLLTCRRCGRAMIGVSHTSKGGGCRRYYKCTGREPVCPSHQSRCTRTNVKVDDLDAAVWGHIRRLLDDPATLSDQFESFIRPAGENMDSPAGDRKVDVQLRRLDREEVRLVDAYQAEVIGLDELKERRQQIQSRRQILIAHAAEQEKLDASLREAQAVWQVLSTFCERIRSRLDQLPSHEKQRILQLLVERIIVGEDTLEIRHVIPLRSLKSESPEGAIPCGRSGRSDAEGASSEQPEVRLRTDRVRGPAGPAGRAVRDGREPAGGGAERPDGAAGGAAGRAVRRGVEADRRLGGE